LIVVFIAVFLLSESVPALRHVGFSRFFTDPSWHPSARAVDGYFNIAPMLVGTLAATLGAIILATPLGIISALFCHFYAPSLIARVYHRLIELLAGIPSVVYGFWGLIVLVPLIAQLHPPGQSLLATILVLTIMILPTIALTTDAALINLPPQYLCAAAALGFSRSGTICRVVLPGIRSGLFTGVLLATARAIGETMAVLMVCGNVVQNPHSLFDPIRTLTANIALEMAYASGDQRSALFVSGLLLVVLVAILVFLAHYFNRGFSHRMAYV
jgi:phosphate transport system permease protein